MAYPVAPPHPPGPAWPGSDGSGGTGWGGPPALPPPTQGWGEERRANALAMPAPARPPPQASSSSPAAAGDDDPLDLAIDFLKKRDGVDKLLKLIRYAAKLALATTHSAAPVPAAVAAAAWAGGGGGWAPPPSSPAYFPAPPRPPGILTPARLGALEASIGDARKAYRLGKWLQGVAGFREAGGLAALAGGRGPGPALAALAAAGDAVYFFLEQGTWLVRTRVAPPHWGRPIARASATAELVSYAGSAGLALLTLDGLALREVTLARALAAARAAWPGEEVHALVAELGALRARRATLRLALLQDACDALLASADLRPPGGGKAGGRGGLLDSKAVLAAAGLVSGLLGARKVWAATVKGRADKRKQA